MWAVAEQYGLLGDSMDWVLHNLFVRAFSRIKEKENVLQLA